MTIQKADYVRHPHDIIVAVLKASRLKTASKVGDHYDTTVQCTCEDCELTDVLCNGESVLASGRITVIPGKLISFNFPSFEDTNACVYLGVFKKDDRLYKKILAVIETVTITTMEVIGTPKDGEQFEHHVHFSCDNDCSVEKVSVNGIPLETNTRRSSSVGSIAFYEVVESSVIIRITEYSNAYEGVYQAVFSTSEGPVTKNILEIKLGENL
ncbi:uncharacterized protein LOC114249066 [Bombyx mandarina]|uniref:Uncharacterized protein LOC114249066 n=1 Tax=Bombyx mandarina TaxID=7092 RepID=A0A6J2KBN5_BOMMA|nr:uncharacterized protein LOC114249066 [Bombyx mandarina]